MENTDSVPLSALQHILYCPRQCALIHVERVWTENFLTASGRVMHDRAHEGKDESRPGMKIARALAVRSARLGMHGVCDVVEFHADGQVVPVEYKVGRPKAHRADEVQLCGQALCLEETLTVGIPRGFLFYGATRRRCDVEFDEALRAVTVSAINGVRRLLVENLVPPAEYDQRKCRGCSLNEICQPQTTVSASRWYASQLRQCLEAVA
ncbi:MAG: CRISPR-associated protein Cas4 [Verrucomicrobiales bacterium]|jgi:CRISPR-associated exonuclease Cas4|nr:CRISPR-associated protein Cas4 [Verrucomicrobiales bacterium]